MVVLTSPDETHRIVASETGGAWAVRLEVRAGASWWTAAELLPRHGWPIERAGERTWIAAAGAVPEADRLRLTGDGEIDGHRWRLCDEYAFDGPTLRLVRRWTHDSDAPQDQLDLLIEARCPTGGKQRFLLPGISYDGNANADPRRLVARFPGERPARCLYEEHRYPVPMATCEWAGDAGRSTVSLISRPSRVGPEADDHWWTLGLVLGTDDATIVASSGTVETNGRRGAVYGAQCRLIEVDGWPVTAAPGAAFEKEVLLEASLAQAKGHGFRRALWRAHELFEPTTRPAVTLDGLIDLKLNALRARYAEQGDEAGFLCLPPKNLHGRGPYFLWGWTGQSLLASWSALAEGRRRGKAHLEAKATRTADFFAGQPLPEEPGHLVGLRYLLDEHRWAYDRDGGQEIVSSRQFGEAFTNLARLVELGRHLGLTVGTWLERLKWAADFLTEGECRLPNGLLPHAWTRQGKPLDGPPCAAGAPCISALACAGLLTGTDRYRVAARELLVAYHRTFLAAFAPHPWGSTLDARCEDKEAGLGLMAAALDGYESIGEGRFLDWAKAAADWALTFFFIWDAAFPEGRPRCRPCSTIGWPSVSVQNHHLDVFARPSLFVRLARHSDEPRYADFARTMAQAITQTVATKRRPWDFNRSDRHNVAGEQGEALFHTNYWQGPGDRALWRGGHNTWNPSWVCFQVLAEAILLRDAALGW